MHAGRIIADSDDEDVLSPIPSPIKPTTDWSSAKPSDGTSSTDPVFFQSVYLAQQGAAIASAFGGDAVGSEGHFEPPGLLDGSFRETQDSLPELVSVANAGGAASSLGRASGDLSAKANAEYDPWAMPSSPAEGPRASTRGRMSAIDADALQIVDLVSPERPTHKGRLRTERPGANLDDGDSTQPLGDGTDKAFRNGGTGLYVEASRMTSSQKKQYEDVSLPGLSPLEEPVSLSRNNHLVRSSGSATIAYPTPTQFRSHGGTAASMLPPTAEVPSSEPERGAKRRRLSSFPATADPRSSPDIIAAGPPPKSRSSPTPPPLEHREEHVRQKEDSYDEDWNEKDFGVPRQPEQKPGRQKRAQRANKKGARGKQKEQDDSTTTPLGDGSGGAEDELAHIPTEPRQSTRAKKAADLEQAPAIVVAATAAGEEVRLESAPPQRKKRGRPKKSAKAAIEVQDDVAEAQSPRPPPLDSTAETWSNDVGGKAKEEDKQLGEPGDDAKTFSPAKAKEPTSTDAGTLRGPPKPAAREGGVGTDKAGSKLTPAKEQGTKPVYRVGLSKRTRIAPLLKCIRKT